MKNNNKIPKIIHYCWFGRGKMPELAIKCIDSWKKNLPDYEIKEWNEDNFDINYNRYVKEAYESKKFAFVSDVARLHAIYEYGGIYLDLDVEVLKSLDPLLKHHAYFGFEDGIHINTGQGFGAEKGNEVVKRMLQEYDNIVFKNEDKYDLTPCPIRNTNALKDLGLVQNDKKQTVNGAEIYPTEYFCPKSFETGKITLTKKTFTIHHFNCSWHSEKEKKQIAKRKKLIKKYGEEKGLQKFEKYLKRKNFIQYFFYLLKNPKKLIERIKRK
jgi:hypothetical protein